jgi:hypothetical protein
MFMVTNLFVNRRGATVSIWINTADTHALEEAKSDLRSAIDSCCRNRHGLRANPNLTYTQTR